MKKALFAVVVSCAALSGCTTGQMSQAKVNISQFDNSKNISARAMPALAHSKWYPSNVHFGARWTDRAPQLLSLDVRFMHDYQNLDKLHFNADGYAFDARKLNTTELERNEAYKASLVQYVITVEQAKRILASKDAKFRITTLSGKYTDGAIVLNGDKSMAYESINNVVQAIPQ